MSITEKAPARTDNNPDMIPMTVGQMGFLVDRLHQDCAPLQFIRELTRNAIDAIDKNPDKKGEIRWDVDWNTKTLEDISKLCIIDTGCGMTGEEMARYINKLSSSIHEQSTSGNYGVGAKISAAPANPAGLVYLSWKDGVGYMIQLIRNQKTGQYGLRRWNNGNSWTHIDDAVKPEPIKDHGTMVILRGQDDISNTIDAPPRARMPKAWILRYLNDRFFKFPEGVEVKVRLGWDIPREDTRHNYLRNVRGSQLYLRASCQSKGRVELPANNATAHWWIFKDDIDIDHGFNAPGGQVAALYQDELYEMNIGRPGIAQLQRFGIIFGCKQVVLFIEPNEAKGPAITPNTARTHLLCDGERLDWASYAEEFRNNMPEEIKEYQEVAGQSASNTDHQSAYRARLKSIEELFRFARYRPRPGGKHYIDDSSSNGGGNGNGSGGSRNQSGGSTDTSKSGGSGGQSGGIYSHFAVNQGEEADEVIGTNQPEVQWVSEQDGTRDERDMVDRAAKYMLPQNKLLINADFRAFTDMIARWEQRYRNIPGAQDTIREVVREWFEQQLVEVVMSAFGLKRGGRWSDDEIARLWTEEALTTAVLPRYHIDVSIRRTLGQRLGARRQST